MHYTANINGCKTDNFQSKIFDCILIFLKTKIELLHEKNHFFAYAKTKTQISFMVTVKLVGAFVFTIWIVQSLYFLNP